MLAPYSEQAQINYAHSNMLTKLQFTIHRSDIINFDHLEQLAIRVEKSLRVQRIFRPPPRPEKALLPSLAYRRPKRGSFPRRTAVLHSLEATDDDTTEMQVDESHYSASPNT